MKQKLYISKAIIITLIAVMYVLNTQAQTRKRVVVHMPSINKTIVASSININGVNTAVNGVVSETNGKLAEATLSLSLNDQNNGNGGVAGLTEVKATDVPGCLGNVSRSGNVFFFTCNPGCRICYTYYTLANGNAGPPN